MKAAALANGQRPIEPLQIAAGKYRDGNEDSAGPKKKGKSEPAAASSHGNPAGSDADRKPEIEERREERRLKRRCGATEGRREGGTTSSGFRCRS